MKKHEVDMCNGPLFKKMFFFILPVIASGLLQVLYNAADIVVVGRYAENGDVAVGAVGATTGIINLILNLFVGLGVGVNVVVGQHIGAGKKKDVSGIINTSAIIGLVGGIIMAIVGSVLSESLLYLTKVPQDILPYATRYLKIYFIGTPAIILYNFFSAALRAYGDTKRPLIFLTISGLTNVVLNVIFVTVFGLAIEGVAISTVISQYLSLILVSVVLVKSKDYCKLDLKNIKFLKEKASKIIRVGLPSGLYSSMFTIANIIIQSAVNSYNVNEIVSGCSASANLENFIYIAMNSVSVGTIAFVSQNYGARKYKRLNRVSNISAMMAIAAWGVCAVVMIPFCKELLSVYLPTSPEAVNYAAVRFLTIVPTYFLLALIDVYTSSLRGMGYSVSTMVISLFFTCIFRIIWIFTVFEYAKEVMPIDESMNVLYSVYTISWLLTLIIMFTTFKVVLRKKIKRQKEEQKQSENIIETAAL